METPKIRTTTRGVWLPFAIAIAMLLSACGGGGETEDAGAPAPETSSESGGDTQDSKGVNLDGVEVDYWHIQATVYGDAVTQIVEDFNNENPYGIKVNEIFQGSYDELNQKIRAALAGGGTPTVTMAYEDDILEYDKADVVVALDEFIDDPEFGITDAEREDMLPAILERQSLPAYDGRTLSWPHGNSSQGMYRNLDMLEAAGITAPPASWDEFIDQARKVKEATGNAYLATTTGLNWHLYNIMRSYGQQPWDGNSKEVYFDTPEAVRAFEVLETLFAEDLAISVEDPEQEFTNERAAIEIGTTARVETKEDQILDSFEWDVVLTPQETEDKITNMWGGNHAILSQDDEKKELAGWLFMRYFAGPEAQATYAALTGYSPADRSSLEFPKVEEAYSQIPQKMQVFENVFQFADINPPSAAAGSLHDLVINATTEVTLGRTTPEEASKSLQSKAEQVMEDLG